jgi:Response regulator containing CheY-like receiver, AAA-type ATPase, and DNA-binding domains
MTDCHVVILCVDPDDTARARTTAALADAGFETHETASVRGAQAALDDADAPPECVVTEYDLPDGTGLDLVRAVREETPDTACILFTATTLDEVDTAAFGNVVAEYLLKDVSDAHDELAALVEHSLTFLSQTSYPLPPDEGVRLRALDRYTTVPAALDDALDRLTTLAGSLFDVDSAFVSLVDAHHERLLACHGPTLENVPRENSVCTYAILEEGVTVVEHISDDPRFASNELLAALDVEFYAGASLVTDDGQAIGSFCLMDDEPRSFPAAARDELLLFADEAMDQLELRRQIRELEGTAPNVEVSR